MPTVPSPDGNRRKSAERGIAFHHPLAFWLGTAALTVGVLLHIPDYVGSASMGFRMAGMEMGTEMNVGMALIIGGIVAAAFGLIRWRDLSGSDSDTASDHPTVHLHAMDNAPLSPAHWGLLFVLGVALIVDVMKPATLGFVMPGMKIEYGLTTKQVAFLPVVALTGTTLGSLAWGWLSDHVGRRSAILLASLMFIGTSICGFMPSFGWNLFMCFTMGLSAGGMLPIVYALMAESIPAQKRGWLVVLHAGMGTVGGYIAASGLAALLEPHLTWRILWLAGLPSGLLLLVLNRWIPESPRFLLERGRLDEAEEIMSRYGVVMDRVPVDRQELDPRRLSPIADERKTTRFGQLFRVPYLQQTMLVLTYGVGWGLVNWGFLTFVPAILQDRGVEVGSASKELFLAAVVAIPATVLVAALYGFWSSRRSMILFALITAGSLIGFAIVDPGSGGESGAWLMPLVILLLVGSGGVISMLSPYTAEVYPTHLRGTGSGLAAGGSKVGGIVGPPAMAGVLAVAPGFTLLAPLVAVPLVVSAGLLYVVGIETKDRSLEEAAATQSAGT